MTNPPDPEQVEPFLPNLDYPISKADLVHVAEQEGLGDEALRALRILPNRTYQSQEEVRDEVALGS
ncbi:hypothetical protein GCM10009854_41450 [Saccharopolyspora halophila]|uniref:DUF2795 domain-containing protein n=1 Tax=Saccharopolyspora halophila TaxID=405551 RepID=A0ABN3GQW0_9PSEU